MKTLRYIAVGLLVLNVLLATPQLSGVTANILNAVQSVGSDMGSLILQAYFK